MSARVISEACIALPLLGAGLDGDGVVRNATMRQTILRSLIALEETV